MVGDAIDSPGKVLHQVRENRNVARSGSRFQIVIVDRNIVVHQETHDIKSSAFDGTFDGGVESRTGVQTASSLGELVQHTVCVSTLDGLVKLGMRRLEEGAKVLFIELGLQQGRSGVQDGCHHLRRHGDSRKFVRVFRRQRNGGVIRQWHLDLPVRYDLGIRDSDEGKASMLWIDFGKQRKRRKRGVGFILCNNDSGALAGALSTG